MNERIILKGMLANSVIPFQTVYYFNTARRILFLSKNFRCTERYFAAKKCTCYHSVLYNEVRLRFTPNKLYNSALCTVCSHRRLARTGRQSPPLRCHWRAKEHRAVIITVQPVTPRSVPARDQGKLTTIVLT